MLKDKRLVLNLQHFAEGEGEEVEESTVDESSSTETETTEQSTETNETETQRVPYDRFKTKVDEVNALKKKLQDIEKAEEAEKTRKMEEQNEYKELYEQALETIEKAKEDALTQTKKSHLTSVGYNEAQVDKLTNLVEGESEEEIKASIETLKETFPVGGGYVDPSVDNAHREKPAKKDKTDLGRSLYERIKGKK